MTINIQTSTQHSGSATEGARTLSKGTWEAGKAAEGTFPTEEQQSVVLYVVPKNGDLGPALFLLTSRAWMLLLQIRVSSWE